VAGAGKRWGILGCVVVAVACVAVPRTARAQTVSGDVSRARELFVEATELRDRGDLPSALEKFKAAHVLADNPITTFEVARTYAALGRLVEARDAYASIAVLPSQADETERAAQARRDGAKAAEDLRARLPSLSIKAAVPLSITLDDQAVPAAALETPRAVNPGTHHLVATGAGGVRAERTITLKEGESREVELAVAPSAEARGPKEERPAQVGPPTSPLVEAPSPAAEGSGNHFGPAAYAGFGVGAAAFVTGSIFAAATLSKAGSISTHCATVACEQTGTDAAHSARDLGIAAVVSYTVSAVAAGVGVADLLLYKRAPTTGSDRSLHPWVGLGSAGVSGSF
jgi:hypothetical protein